MIVMEVENLRKLEHDNIIKVFGVCMSEMTLILELCSVVFKLDDRDVQCTNLRQVIDAFADDLPLSIRLSSSVQIATGLEYLHSQGVVHCDMKTANILVAHDWTCKLTDISFVNVKLRSIYSSTVSSRKPIGSVPYQAPELFNCDTENCVPAVDVYSFGLIVYDVYHPQ